MLSMCSTPTKPLCLSRGPDSMCLYISIIDLQPVNSRHKQSRHFEDRSFNFPLAYKVFGVTLDYSFQQLEIYSLAWSTKPEFGSYASCPSCAQQLIQRERKISRYYSARSKKISVSWVLFPAAASSRRRSVRTAFSQSPPRPIRQLSS